MSQPTSKVHVHDVIVIGGGLSGLSAAYHLKKRDQNLDVLVLEAKPRIGGRTLTTDMKIAGGKTAKFDMGGQWVGAAQKDLLELMDELGLSDALFPQWVTGSKVGWLDPKKIVKYNTDLPFYNPLTYLEAFFFMRKFDKLADSLDENNPYLNNAALADNLDSLTVEAYIRQHIYNAELREFFRIGMRACFGMEASQMSALYLLLYVKASGTFEIFLSATDNGCQKWRVKGGTQQISERLADFVGTRNILLNSPVTAVQQDGTRVTVSVESNGQLRQLCARRVISAVPPNFLANMKMKPPMEATRVELLNHMPMGNIYKFMITYEKAFWREKNMSGEIVSYGGNVHCSEDCPVGFSCITFDYCFVDGTPALVGLIGGHHTVYWRQKDFEARKKAILMTLAKMLGDEALKPVDFREKDWCLEEWTGGCPVCILRPGAGRFYTSGLRLPIDNVYLAGTESAQRSCGFMSGAVQAGRRAATEVLVSLEKYSPEDKAILPTTCFGAAGKVMRKPQQWLTVRDPYVASLIFELPIFKILMFFGALAFIKRFICTESSCFWQKAVDKFRGLVN